MNARSPNRRLLHPSHVRRSRHAGGVRHGLFGVRGPERPGGSARIPTALGALRDDGTLNRGQHRALTVKVGQAGALLDRDERGEALDVLEDLRQQVLDLTAEGVLSASQGDALVGAVDRIIHDL